MFNTKLTYREVEALAAQDPRGYRNHLKRLALLGYAFLFGAVLLLLAFAGLLVVAFTAWHFWIIIKWAIFPLLGILALIKSLWVKFEPPQGVELSREDAPALWQMIDEIRESTNCPKVNHLLLNGDFNCAAAQIPRFGFTPPYNTYVIVGLSLMDAVSVEQFRWILAHELGHVSELEDGPLSAWIYHVQMTWIQIAREMEKNEGMGGAVIARFLNWYFPIFSSHSLVLRRAHEYAADAFAAKFAGPGHGIEALLATSIRDNAVSSKFWERAIRKAENSPAPPLNIFTQLRESMRGEVPAKSALEALRLTSRQHDEGDSHPTLYERVKELGASTVDTPEALLELFNAMPPLTETAAQAVFGANLERLEGSVAKVWCDEMREPWKMIHETIVQARKDLDYYRDADVLSMPVRDQIDYAGLLDATEQTNLAIEYLQNAVAHHDDGELHYHLGRRLLEERRDPAGVEHLQRAMASVKWTAMGSYPILYDYYKRIGDDEQAAIYEKRGKELAEELDAAVRTLPELSGSEKFGPPDVSPRILNRARAELYQAKTFSDAWLVTRPLPEILGRAQHCLIVKPSAAFAMTNEDLYREMPLLGQSVVCSDFTLLPYTLIPSGIVSQLADLPQSHIYNRKAYEEQKGKGTA